jgi:putative transposase
MRGRDQRSLVVLRRDIRQQVLTEFPDVATVALDEAVNQADRTRIAVIRKRTRGERCDYRFRTRKNPVQSFVVQKLGSTPYPRILGACHLTEDIPQEAFGKMATVVYEHGRWFLICQKNVAIIPPESQGLRVAAIDPGIRTFATVFSFSNYAKLGEQFAETRLYGLGLQLDRLLGQRATFRNRAPRRFQDWRQIHWDWWKHYEKRINKIRNRMSDLIDDLHRRAAHWLTDNFDVFLLPTFEVKGMTQKQERKIRSKTVRQMLQLGHYRFKTFVKWIARKKGKHVIDVNEAYTSKTDSRTGEIVENLGSRRAVNGLDRDVNGARGILLRALTR